jgi:hypothetical protein
MTGEILEQKNPVCLMCKHYLGGWRCKAFNEIPMSILRGENDHSTPLPNQGNDIVFEEKRTVVDINPRSNQN